LIFGKAALKQARKGILISINENPSAIIIMRKALVDDGFGGKVENPYGTATSLSMVVRIADSRRSVSDCTNVDSGFAQDYQKIIISDYESDINPGDVFEAEGKNYKINQVTPLYKFGGLIGYQGNLSEAE